MIVISGVLLLIAVVFLVIGLFGPLAWVYASIAVSVLSFVFLLVGVRQRRDIAPAGAVTPAVPRGSSAEETAADVTLVPAGGRRPSASVPSVPAVVLEDVAPPARIAERPRPAAAAPVRRPRPAATSSSASSRLRGAGTSARPRAVLPARLADPPAKKAAAKKAAPAKAAVKKAAPAKAAAKKAAPAKAAVKKAAPAKKATPAKAAAKKAAPAKKAAAKKTAAKKTTGR